MAIHTLLTKYPIMVEFPVAWGEMDAFQHVNNTVYFRYFESARMAYFSQLELVSYMKATGIGPILASTQCRFKIPLSYPDTVSVGANVSDIQSDRFLMNYLVVSHSQEKVAAEGNGLIVMYDYHHKHKTSLPEEIRQRILNLENLCTSA